MTLGEKIYKLRTKRSMTQEQLAEKIGVSRQSVSKWETDSAIPDIEKLKLLAEFYRSVRCSEDGKIYLKLKCVLVRTAQKHK